MITLRSSLSSKIMIKDFCDKLEGFYDNWNQASSNPAKYAHVKLKWERISENELSSKQWYHYMGEETPYRNKWHRVSEDEGVIIVQNWTPKWRSHNHCCDMMFFPIGDYYDGRVKTDACIINGGVVRSTVKFNGVYYKSRDQGWRDDEVVWGSDEIYELQKSDGPIAL
jgi:hypothetical protein